MAKPLGQTIKSQVIRHQPEEVPLAEIYDYLEGLYTDGDPTQIPLNALTQALNVEYFRRMLFRRNGMNAWPITKPNSNRVMHIFPFFETTTGLNILRFTPGTIYKSGSAGWTQFNPTAIPAMSGGNGDFFSTAVIDNRGFFTNGVDPIREVDPTTDTYKAVGNAPIYRFITSAFNRLIGCNLVAATDLPSQVGWSGESNLTEWDPTVDISAGSQNLTTSPTTITDDCTGIFSTAQILIITRQNSIWLATHLPSATSPFSFFAQLPHIGADLPRTIKLTDFGLVWVENQSSSVYAWTPGAPVNNPDDILISGKIRRALRSALNNADQVWSTYSHESKFYTLFISYSTTSTVTTFTFDFITKTWASSEIGNEPTYAIDIDYANSTLTINELSGTIAALLGTIDSLGGLQQNTTRAIGYNNGDILTQEPFSGLPDEVSNIVLTDNGTAFTSTIAQKIIEVPIYDTYINLARFMVTPYSTGTVTMSYSKDDGNTWTVAKSVTFTQTYRQQLVQLRKSLKGRRFIWRIQTSDCMCSINGFNLTAIKAGISK